MCKPARRNTGARTQMLQSTSQSVLRSAQRGGRPCSLEEKRKSEDMPKVGKAHYEKEIRPYIPPKGETKKEFKDPNAPNRSSSAFLFCSEYHPKSKDSVLACPLVMLQRSWGRCGIIPLQVASSLTKKKDAKLKVEHGRNIAAY